ncbi:MAG: GtrA family protein [Gammaproteobacteria bacterium]|nr:GtrA family protein [Gammaproteobacteria bacterium]
MLILKEGMMSQFKKFIASGLINSAVGYGVFIFAVYCFDIRPAVANVLGYSIALVVAFWLNKVYVFSRINTSLSFFVVMRFLLAFSLAFSVNQIVLFVFVDELNFRAEISQVFAMGSYTVLFYFLNKIFVFKSRAEKF